MDLKRLGHLVALAEERNFNRAARKVHLSQPAFSRSVQAAEAELGLALFERTSTEVTCTPAGRFVVECAQRLLGESSRFQRDIDLYRNREIGELALGFGQFTAARLLPPLLADLRQRYPRVKVRVQVQSASHLLAPLQRQEIDFFVGDARFAVGDATLDVKSIGAVAGKFYVRSGHPLLGRAALRMADLPPFGLATGKLPLSVQKRLLGLMGLEETAALPIAVECDDILSLKAIILATDAIMVGTPALVEQEIAAGTLCALPLTDLPKSESHLAIVSLRGRTFSPVADYASGFLQALVASQKAA